MAGRFNKSVRPILPGSYFAFEADTPIEVIPNPGSTVLVPIIHDWGPADVAVLLASPQEFDAVYGKTDTLGRRAVINAFLGENNRGKGGAANVIAYRMVGSAVASGTRTLQNTTPALALTLTARYSGSRANALRISVGASPATGFNILTVLDGAAIVEQFEHAQTDINALAADINASSSYFTAVANLSGVALAVIANAAVAGGNDGSTLATGDWSAMQDDVEYEAFGVMVPYDLTDSAVQASMVAWLQGARSRGKRFTLVLGGPLGETFAAHKTRAAGYNDEDVVAFGTGTVGDTSLYNDGTELTMSTAQFAARVAGSIARRGEKYDLVNARFAGARIIAGATLTQAQIAAGSGMTLLTRDGDSLAPVKIGDGVTSYQGGDPLKPKRIYNRVKFMRTLQGIESEITADQEGDLIEGQSVTDRTRDIVIGRAKSIIDRRVGEEIVQPGPTIVLDLDPPPTALDDFVQLRYGVGLVPGLRQIFNSIKIAA